MIVLWALTPLHVLGRIAVGILNKNKLTPPDPSGGYS